MLSVYWFLHYIDSCNVLKLSSWIVISAVPVILERIIHKKWDFSFGLIELLAKLQSRMNLDKGTFRSSKILSKTSKAAFKGRKLTDSFRGASWCDNSGLPRSESENRRSLKLTDDASRFWVVFECYERTIEP